MGRIFAGLMGLGAGIAIGASLNEKNMKTCRKMVRKMM